MQRERGVVKEARTIIVGFGRLEFLLNLRNVHVRVRNSEDAQPKFRGLTASFLLDKTQLVSYGTRRIDVRFGEQDGSFLLMGET